MKNQKQKVIEEYRRLRQLGFRPIEAAPLYEVVVGNIGQVYSGDSLKIATEKYDYYVLCSKRSDGGQASGKDVTLFKDGDIRKEYWEGR